LSFPVRLLDGNVLENIYVSAIFSSKACGL